MFNYVIILSSDTLKKEFKSKTVVLLFFLTSALILMAGLMLKNSIESGLELNLLGGKNIITMMFSFLNFWGVAISIFFGVGALRSDFQSNIIHQYLAFPISRFQYLMGRLFGAWLLVMIFYGYSYLLTTITFGLVDKSFLPQVIHLMSLFVIAFYSFIFLVLTFMISFYLGKLGTFVTMIFTSATISAVQSHFTTLSFTEQFTQWSFFKTLGLVIYWIFPHLNFLGELGNYFLVQSELTLKPVFEIPHLILSTSALVACLYLFIRKRSF